MYWIIGLLMLAGAAGMALKVTAFAARVVLGVIGFLGLLLIIVPLVIINN